MAEYVILIEKAGNNYAAMGPDLPGCIGTADTIEELRREATQFHIEGMRIDGEAVPPPSTLASVVRVVS